jgi:hypothetical protein
MDRYCQVMLHAPDRSTTFGGEPDEQRLEPTDLMADPHCRHLLEYLRETEGTTSLEEVSRHVVAEITDSPVDEVPPAVLRRVQTWFHHGQLPQLDDIGVVEFDPDAGVVRLTGTADPRWRVGAHSVGGGS